MQRPAPVRGGQIDVSDAIQCLGLTKPVASLAIESQHLPVVFKRPPVAPHSLIQIGQLKQPIRLQSLLAQFPAQRQTLPEPVERLVGFLFRSMYLADVKQADRFGIRTANLPEDAKRARAVGERGRQFVEDLIDSCDSNQRRGFALSVTDKLKDGFGLTM